MNISTIKHNLPVAGKVYNSLDIIGNTFGRYFDYKKETAMIEYEIEKLHAQTKVITERIKAELQVSLDNNQKNFTQEMFRLEAIANELKQGAVRKNEIMANTTLCIEALVNPNTPTELLEKLCKVIENYNNMIIVLEQEGTKRLSLMSHFTPSVKLIEG
ncbi:MAG: hypothetical protein L3J43_10420 [Sulfurovum sp.]|nr:hypothetical protein [Sulfurovum sp.]